jgi:hypothetical protein
MLNLFFPSRCTVSLHWWHLRTIVTVKSVCFEWVVCHSDYRSDDILMDSVVIFCDPYPHGVLLWPLMCAAFDKNPLADLAQSIAVRSPGAAKPRPDRDAAIPRCLRRPASGSSAIPPRRSINLSVLCCDAHLLNKHNSSRVMEDATTRSNTLSRLRSICDPTSHRVQNSRRPSSAQTIAHFLWTANLLPAV